jgi:hypothetical protein
MTILTQDMVDYFFLARVRKWKYSWTNFPETVSDKEKDKAPFSRKKPEKA